MFPNQTNQQGFTPKGYVPNQNQSNVWSPQQSQTQSPQRNNNYTSQTSLLGSQSHSQISTENTAQMVNHLNYLQRLETMHNKIFRQETIGATTSHSQPLPTRQQTYNPNAQTSPNGHLNNNINSFPNNTPVFRQATLPQQPNFIQYPQQQMPQWHTQQGNIPVQQQQQQQQQQAYYGSPVNAQQQVHYPGQVHSMPMNPFSPTGNLQNNNVYNFQQPSGNTPVNFGNTQPVQFGGYKNPYIPANQIPFNMQRANLVHNVSYQVWRPPSEIRDQYKVLDTDTSSGDSSGVLRISTLQSSFQNNPYYHDLDNRPSLLRPEELRSTVQDKESIKKEEERLRMKVFSSYSYSQHDFSEFMMLLGKMKASNQKYVDNDFPPSLSSLIGNNTNRKAEWGSAVWLRAEEFYGCDNFDVFKDDIEPGDIRQGELGDCYFLSTISSLAEWPNRIRKLFGAQRANSCGLYCVKVCEMGEWKEVYVDDYFPCDKYSKKPIFTKGNDNELWVLILEKIWAKIYGSYDAIEAGIARECLHDLTGAPTKFFLTDRKEEWDMIWKKICKAEEKQYAMTCGAGDFFTQSTTNMVNSKGLVSSHAYSLLAAHDIQTEKGRVRLVKLRNPWGKTEWKGPWSDSSDTWTPDLKKKLGWQDKDDGIFFMAYEDFLKYFSDIQFCYVNDDFKYKAMRVTSDPKHAIYFRFNIDAPGNYYITVNQQSKRKNASNPSFRYSTVSIVVAKVLPNNQYEYITGNNRADREVWAKGKFTAGEYLVYAKVQWTSGEKTDFVLSSYGPSTPKIETVSKKSIPGFLEKTFISKAKLSSKKMDYGREGESDCYSVVDISRDGFIYCYYNNMSSRALETEVYFKEFNGVKLRKPYRGQSFKLTVLPKQDGIVLLRILPNRDVKQVLSEKVRFIKDYNASSTTSSAFGGNSSIITNSPPKFVNLDREARENGDPKRVRNNNTDEVMDIFIYQYKHNNGVYLLFENRTADSLLEAKVMCELEGLEPIGMTGRREIDFKVSPGSSHRIGFAKTANVFDAKFKYKSRVKKV